ncbi:inositol monophosphatase [Haematobacter missouriensis]|uniref:3'(2'),5'-bisphosphate nucleotidase CysQ n=1 Tax=Haematobacter missouriensis TaxID=366616 RepID=A0A212AM26_9RHOB|nr:3'(2'),5'-bisphosphate nucleotidase CysQ [Haematobacter missouriensis]KFI32878.1 inositol monophosphatase [Haematobacter missouriensis]OWJ73118.1 3'(2'),5'-bisphosphate nucleotidase CysQ [Haematobacter missouriensis]OWJ82564.1 3'(2'),5'-bisphosphate nucleotidase CysQ [Haematobacter missouriensis]
MPDHDLTLLIDAAQRAGEISSRYWRREPEAWEKPGGAGPVTEADLAVNRMLREHLATARPEYGWLSEESDDNEARLGARRVFIVDPIDGTRSFMAGEPSFAHSIAVAEEGRVIAGVVYLPQMSALYTATAEGPAALNGVPIGASGRTDPSGGTILATRPVLQSGMWRGGLIPPMRQVFRASIAFRLCLIAEGRFDALVVLRDTWEWDMAAGALIAARAGAVVTDRRGEQPRFNRRVPLVAGIVAASPELQGKLLDGLVPHP